MRRMNICEERGSGIDKVIEAIELFQLPAPDFTTPLEFTKATLFALQNLNDMNSAARIRACYQHAYLCFVTGQKMTNASFVQFSYKRSPNDLRRSRPGGCISNSWRRRAMPRVRVTTMSLHNPFHERCSCS